MYNYLFTFVKILKLLGPNRKLNKPIIIIICRPNNTFLTKPWGYWVNSLNNKVSKDYVKI